MSTRWRRYQLRVLGRFPPASALNKGERIVVIDAFGGIGGANTLSVVRDGADTINGGTAAVVLNTAYGSTQLMTDGVSNWGVVASGGGGGGMPGGSTTQVQYNNTGSFGGSAEFGLGIARAFDWLGGLRDGAAETCRHDKWRRHREKPGCGRHV